MSKHWNPRLVQVSRRPLTKRRSFPSHRANRHRSFSGKIQFMVLGGVFLGFAYVSVPLGEIAPPDGGGAAVTNPWTVRITDGDTFRYGGETIRIGDIDTPEVDGRCAYESRLAAQATARMEELLHAGPFEMHPIAGRDEDRYGRKLRVVTRGGVSLGDVLVSEGLARTWAGRREPWC